MAFSLRYTATFLVCGLGVESQQNGLRQVPNLRHATVGQRRSVPIITKIPDTYAVVPPDSLR